MILQETGLVFPARLDVTAITKLKSNILAHRGENDFLKSAFLSQKEQWLSII